MNAISRSIDTPQWVACVLGSPATRLLARIALTLPFWWSGIDKAFHPHAALDEIAGLLNTSTPLLAYVALLFVQLGGSALVLLNRRAWLGAGALAVFTLIVTVLAHPFWNLHDATRFAEMNTFLEHMALTAAFVFAAIAASAPEKPIR